MIRKDRLAIVAVVVIVACAVMLVWSSGSTALDRGVTPQQGGGSSSERSAAVRGAEAEAVRTPAEVSAPIETVVASAEPRSDELWGRVVRADDGAPIAGADVRLLHRDADEFWNLDLDYGAKIDELGRTTSAADGRFRFDVTRARNHRLHVRASGFATATVVDQTGGTEVIVAMTTGSTVEGVVRSGGALLVGVTVRIAVVGQSIELASGAAERDGSFRFADLQPAQVFVQVKTEDHAEVWKRLALVAGVVHHLEIDLPEGRALSGLVKDIETGQPIADARVSDSWTFKRVVRSDRKGEFTLRGLTDEGFVSVHVRADGYASMTRNLTGALGEVVEFALTRGGIVAGRVTDASGASLQQVYLAAGASYMEGPGIMGADWLRGQIAGNGLFVVSGLRPDQHYWLYVRGRGHGTRVYALPRVLKAGERIDVGDIVMRAAGGVEGRVIDDQGRAISGTSVSISGTNADHAVWMPDGIAPRHVSAFELRSIQSDRLGRFRFTNLSAGSYEVSVHPGDQARAIAQRTEVSDGAILEGMTLVVATGEEIEGTLRYGDGHGLGDEAGKLSIVATRETGESSFAQVAADGHFSFAGLEKGTYTLSMFRCPAGWTLSPRVGVTSSTKDLELVMEPAAVIAGRVVDLAGKGIKARVWLQWEDRKTGGSRLHSTDDDGEFSIEVAADFRGSLHAMDPVLRMLQDAVEAVAAGQSDLVLTLKK